MTNEWTWAIYRRKKMAPRKSAEATEVLVSTGFATAGKAMDEANRLARKDDNHTYLVGVEWLSS